MGNQKRNQPPLNFKPMANWLESEESNKKKLLENEDNLHKMLKNFFDLCSRVNTVKPNSLEISKLKVIGTKQYTIKHVEEYEWGDREGIYGKNGILFSMNNVNEIFIDVIIDQNNYYIHNKLGDCSVRWDNVLFRKIMTSEDILNWPEQQMLNTIQWIIKESKSIKENIPGEITLTDEEKAALKLKMETEAAALRVHKETRRAQLTQKLAETINSLQIAKNFLEDIRKYKIGRSASRKELELDSQKKTIENIEKEIIRIQSRLSNLDVSN